MTGFMEGRDRIEAQSLQGPRVYSTDLFAAHFNTSDPNPNVELAARAIKIKIITKGLVTLNSMSLLTPTGVALFEKNTDLFDGEALVPAVRLDQANLSDLVARNEKKLAEAGIGKARIDEHLARLDSTVKRVMPWSLGDVGESYRQGLIATLSNEHSQVTIETAKRGFTPERRQALIAKIEDLDMSASDNLRRLMEAEPEEISRLLQAFANASYHKIGAGVVNCEVGTDLDPMAEFKAADRILAARSADGIPSFTDEAIFLEVFATLALSAIQSYVAPEALIDVIDFKTAHQLSDALRHQGFQSEYDDAVKKIMSLTPINGAVDINTIDVENISEAVSKLHERFGDLVTQQLSDYRTKSQDEAKQRLVEVGADLARDGAAQVPGLSNIVSTFDAVEHVRQGLEAAAELWSIREAKKALADGARRREEKMKAAIDVLYTGKDSRAKLLDGVALMSDLYVRAIDRT